MRLGRQLVLGLVPALFGVVFVASPPAGAQITEADAVKELKQESKDLLKLQAGEIKGARTTWLANFNAVQSELKQGYDAGAIGTLFNGLDELQIDLWNASVSALSSLQTAGFFSLIELGEADGTTLAGIYPKDFYMRSGGTAERTSDKIEKNYRGALALAQKKVKGLRKKAEKKGTALAVYLDTAPGLYEAVWNEDSAFTPGGHEFTLDLIVAASDLDVQGDGRILASGWQGDAGGSGDVEVWIQGPAGTADMLAVTPNPDGRWVRTLVGLEEGNYIVGIRPEGHDVQWIWKTIGVR